ncbi:MAG: rod shape-determining protein MreC [Synergistetes bacterium]|nr:MAG: Cell shape-determining protein MreC [bacterium 42_11]MBC7331313.1 rod shape-determining protein MreC [Synergistota bacterium]MDK2871263.1 rod shape-determining protein MreC [bacterium]
MERVFKGWFLVGVLLFSSLFLASLSLRGWSGIDFLKNHYISLALPVEKVISFPLFKVRDFFSFLYFRADLLSENEELKREVALLRYQLSLLRSNLNGDISPREGFIPCKVVYRFPDRWFGEMVVDKGMEDGVAVGMAVLGERGLIGEVIEVGAKISRVKLITSYGSVVGALVVRSRSFGVLRGTGTPYCELLYIPEEGDVSTGDEIVTAGMGEKIPAGIPIGEVVNVSKRGDVLEIKVKPVEDFSKLRYVWILKEG